MPSPSRGYGSCRLQLGRWLGWWWGSVWRWSGRYSKGVAHKVTGRDDARLGR